MGGIVQRVLTDPFRVEYRVRNAALFAEQEWGWGSRDDAFVFEMYQEATLPTGAYEKSACSHVADLRAAGEPHAHAIDAVICGADRTQERERRAEARVEALVASARDAGVASTRQPSTIADRVNKARKGRRRRMSVAPSDVYSNLEQKGLA